MDSALEKENTLYLDPAHFSANSSLQYKMYVQTRERK